MSFSAGIEVHQVIRKYKRPRRVGFKHPTLSKLEYGLFFVNAQYIPNNITQYIYAS